MSELLKTEEQEARAALYALGALSLHEARAFDEDLSALPEEAWTALAEFEAVVDHLGLGAPAATPPPAVRAQLLARLATTPQPEQIEAEPPVAPFYETKLNEGEWHPFAAGVEFKILFTDQASNTVTSLLKMSPGSHLPAHDHHGVEQCTIISGDFHVGEQTFGPGDFQCALPGSTHDDLYTEAGALVLIVAPLY